MTTFLSSNKTLYRLARTILQGIIGVIVAYIDVIVGAMAIPNEMRPMIVALVMAILSPIMSELGASAKAAEKAQQIQTNFNEDGFVEMMDTEFEDFDEEMENEDEDTNDLSE